MKVYDWTIRSGNTWHTVQATKAVVSGDRVFLYLNDDLVAVLPQRAILVRGKEHEQ